MTTKTSSLLSRVNAVAHNVPGAIGDTVRHSLNILAGGDDLERKTVRVYDKIVALDDESDREAALAAIEQLAAVEVEKKPHATS